MNELQSPTKDTLTMSIERFRSGELGLCAAAKHAGIPLSELISLVSQAGVPVLDQAAKEYESDVRTLDAWLKA